MISNHLLHQLQETIPFTSPVFTQQIFKKNKFQVWWGLGALVIHVLLKLLIFNIKISTEILRVNYYLLLKNLQEAMHLAYPTWTKPPTKFNPKMQDFKRMVGLTCK